MFLPPKYNLASKYNLYIYSSVQLDQIAQYPNQTQPDLIGVITQAQTNSREKSTQTKPNFGLA